MMRRTIALTLLLALGCGDDKNSMTTDGGTDGATGTAGTTETATTTMTPTGGTTTDSGTMGGTQSTGTSAPTTTGGEMTTGVDTTTGGGSDGVEEECAAVCGPLVECGLLQNEQMCVNGCLGDFGGGEGACDAAIGQFLLCLSGMECQELQTWFETEEPGSCTDAYNLAEQACDGGMMGDCVVSFGSNQQGTECFAEQVDCPGEPDLQMQCNETECVCLVDGVETAICPADGVCQMEDQIGQKSLDCCGF